MFSRVSKIFLIAGLATSISLNEPAFSQNENALPGALPQNPPDKASPSPAVNPPPSTAQNQPAPITAIEPTQPVITIHGLCDQPPAGAATDAASCTTVVTKEQFEYLMSSINLAGLAIPPDKRQNLAQAYVQFLAFDRAARKAGFEDTAQFAEIMRWMRLRAIADVYRLKLQEESKAVSQAEIDAYYTEHLSTYDRVAVARILIPRRRPDREDKDFDQKAAGATKIAHERTSKGDDPEQVEKDAYSALEISSPPPTNIGTRKRSDFIADEAEEIFSLKQGDVTKVETEPASYVIYKIISKETLPEEKVKEEISRAISQRKFNDAFQSIVQSVQPEYNQNYFGPPGAAPAVKSPAPPSNPHPH